MRASAFACLKPFLLVVAAGGKGVLTGATISQHETRRVPGASLSSEHVVLRLNPLEAGSEERDEMRRVLALICFAAVSLFSATPPNETPPADPKPGDPAVTSRSDVSLKRVDVQAVDSGNRPITGLTKDDFVLRE